MIKKLVLIIMLVACAAMVTGCNTMQGLGKDIKHLGKAIENSSDKK